MSNDTSKKPEFEIPSENAPVELILEDIVIGTGAEATAGATIDAHYVGKAWSNGQQFDASWDRGQPLSFPVGAGRVIEGWDKGLLGMKVGGRRKITIPPHLGYGEYGAPGAIAPNETLVFVVDLVGVR
ncbi:FKBP-type peptidyl-prolyl cis-trans isomerase [Cumulibacter soli]|uniref:FKBP-type peptidyl-prolyl cis-trans isomerase n=1 Tax=Cumulibacter soli TaxID=2546344 RepID=UPI001067FEC5|nr:FKBP-type peptidyl-prolyl cis-trans isomerase [Cumulibacter soli]